MDISSSSKNAILISDASRVPSSISGNFTSSSVKPQISELDNRFGVSIVGMKNKLINGNFDIWQRAASQTNSGYGSDDRWLNQYSGSSASTSQQLFVLGQTAVPNNPTYFSRTVVTSVAGASNFVVKTQRIESVSTLAGKPATLSFWAKADSNKSIAIEFQQYFGGGGSPSATILGLGVTKFNLTTVWQKFSTTINMPSITGKVLGTTNDQLDLYFWFEGGSNYNIDTNSLGQQSGTFDIAQVQLEEGKVATSFAQRHIAQELALCKRYYQYVYFDIYSNALAGYITLQIQNFPTMRALPTFTIWPSYSINLTNIGFISVSTNAIRASVTNINNANAEWSGYLYLDAEL